MSTIVEVAGLRKRFGDIVAVEDVSFTIAEGEIFGLLGPNGAGKTTTISMVSCLLSADAGTITVNGHNTGRDPIGVKRSLGVVPQEIALYPTLTAAENLAFWGRMYGLSGADLKRAVDEALELAGLADRAKERVETYSGGMKRRLSRSPPACPGTTQGSRRRRPLPRAPGAPARRVRRGLRKKRGFRGP